MYEDFSVAAATKLAKAVASSENIRVRYEQGLVAAYADTGGNIVLPVPELETILRWRGTTHHEISHLFSGNKFHFDMYKECSTKIHQSLVNFISDYLVDRSKLGEFPGRDRSLVHRLTEGGMIQQVQANMKTFTDPKDLFIAACFAREWEARCTWQPLGMRWDRGQNYEDMYNRLHWLPEVMIDMENREEDFKALLKKLMDEIDHYNQGEKGSSQPVSGDTEDDTEQEQETKQDTEQDTVQGDGQEQDTGQGDGQDTEEDTEEDTGQDTGQGDGQDTGQDDGQGDGQDDGQNTGHGDEDGQDTGQGDGQDTEEGDGQDTEEDTEEGGEQTQGTEQDTGQDDTEEEQDTEEDTEQEQDTKEDTGEVNPIVPDKETQADDVTNSIERLFNEVCEGGEYSGLQEHQHHDFTSYGTHYNGKVRSKLGSLTVSKKIQKHLLAVSRDTYQGGKKRGKLNKRKLGKHISTGYDRVYKQRVTSQINIDTAVGLLIDCSGSMCSTRYPIAAACGVALSTTLTALKVPHFIQGFTCETDWYYDDDDDSPEKGVLHTIHFKKVEEELSKEEILKRFEGIDYGVMSTNADGESILIACDTLMEMQQENKVLLVFSDGQPTSGGTFSCGPSQHLQNVTAMIERETDIYLGGIGIKTDAVRNYYSNHESVHNLSDLDGVLFTILKDRVMRR